MRSLDEMIDQLNKEKPQTVSVAQAGSQEVLKAVKLAADSGIADFILTGNAGDIEEKAKKAGLDLNQPGISVQDCSVEEAAEQAVKAVHNKKADVVMKGHIDTKSLLKQVLHREYGLRGGGILSHVSLFEIPNYDRLIFLTDAGMNIAPSLEEKVQIIENSVAVARQAGWENPKVAPLAAVEVVNPSMPATLDAAVLTQMNRRGQIKNCLIDGPLAFDNAVDLRAAEEKGIKSEVAGAADILLVPSIEAANALYKSFMYFANAKVAAVISGAKAPIVLTSRADTAESKLYSLALALQSTTK